MRSYRVTVETEKGAAPADVIVGDLLAALEGTPGVVDPTATRDAEGVLSATFTVLEVGLDRAGARAGELFRDAVQRAGVDAQWARHRDRRGAAGRRRVVAVRCLLTAG